MSGTTTNYSLPYPTGSDSLQVAADIQALAEACDTQLAAIATGGTYTLPVATSTTLGGVLSSDTIHDSDAFLKVADTGKAYIPGMTADRAGAARACGTGTRDTTLNGAVYVDTSTGDTAGQLYTRAATAAYAGAVEAGATLSSTPTETNYGTIVVDTSTSRVYCDYADVTQSGCVRPDGETIYISNSNGCTISARTLWYCGYLSSSSWSLTNAAAQLTFNRSNGNKIFSGSGGFYTTTSGWYMVTCMLNYNSATSGDSIHCTLYAGTSAVTGGDSWQRAGGATGQVVLSRAFYLSAGTYYYIYAYNASASRGKLVGGSSGSCWLSVHSIS